MSYVRYESALTFDVYDDDCIVFDKEMK